MPKPKNKQELISFSNDNFNKINELINSFDKKELLYGKIPFEDRDKNIRDILGHLHQWHVMFLSWYEVGMQGNKPEMPLKGYTFKTTPALNLQIWKNLQIIPYEEVSKMFNESFSQIQKIISNHNNEELFDKKRYKWTGSTSLASYLISASSSHYLWAIKKITKYNKSLKR